MYSGRTKGFTQPNITQHLKTYLNVSNWWSSPLISHLWCFGGGFILLHCLFPPGYFYIHSASYWPSQRASAETSHYSHTEHVQHLILIQNYEGVVLPPSSFATFFFPCCRAVFALTVCLCGWPCCSGGSGLLFLAALSLPPTASHSRPAEALAPSPCPCRGSTSPGTNTYHVERPGSDRMRDVLHIQRCYTFMVKWCYL